MRARLIVPLDGSEAALAALPYAELIPSLAVTLLHVLPSPPIIGGEEMTDDQRQAIVDYLRDNGERLRQQGRTVDVAIEGGDAAAAIMQHAEAADMIVMTTRGRGAGERVMHGSVADRVARHASTPTLLVRTHPGMPAQAQIARVVVPLDGSALAEAALPHAAEIAADLGIPLHLIRAMDVELLRETARAGIFAAMAYAGSLDAARAAARTYLEDEAKRLVAHDLRVTTAVADGPAFDEVLAATGRNDLIVMTTHGRGGVGRWIIGSVAEKLVRYAEAPVLIVRPQSVS